MRGIFSSQRFGRPQLLAGVLLLVFIGECAWLVAHEYPGTFSTSTSEVEFVRIEEGLAQWHGQGIAGTPSVRIASLEPAPAAGDSYDPHHSPLWYLIASAPVYVFHVSADSRLWIWLTRAPYIVFGTLLGASLWYVSRRLYGNPGGYIALGLYCFSPAVIRSSALWAAPPDVAGAWGTFGAVFTAIAVSHTLYAPREVVLWNWRRIVLLGVSLTLAMGSQFGLAVILPVLLAFMLYLAPDRKAAVAIILTAACVIALLLLLSSYFFHLGLFFRGLRHARLLDASWRSLKNARRLLLPVVKGSSRKRTCLAPACSGSASRIRRVAPRALFRQYRPMDHGGFVSIASAAVSSCQRLDLRPDRGCVSLCVYRGNCRRPARNQRFGDRNGDCCRACMRKCLLGSCRIGPNRTLDLAQR